MNPPDPLVVDLRPAPHTWTSLHKHLSALGDRHAVVLRHLGGPLATAPQTHESLDLQRRCIQELSSPALLSVLQVRYGGDESILTLSVASTLRIASVDATLSAHFWAAGRLPLLSSRLSADPSARRAVVRLCLGDTLDAQEARSQGLLDLVVEEAALDATALDFAVRAQRTDRALLTESLNLLQSGARENHAYDSDALHRWTQDERDVL